MVVDNKKEKRKPGGGRKPSKPDYDPGAILQQQIDAAVILYGTAEHPSLQTIADELDLNPIKVRKLLITAGVYKSEMWYPTSVKCILRNEKYAGDSLMQKYYTANHLEHDSTPNKDLAVTQYFKEDTHPAIVPRDVYQDANLVLMMRDMKRGGNTYPCLRQLR